MFFCLNKQSQSESQDIADIISGRYKIKLSILLVIPVEGAVQRVLLVWLAEKETQTRDFVLDSTVRNLGFAVEN